MARRSGSLRVNVLFAVSVVSTTCRLAVWPSGRLCLSLHQHLDPYPHADRHGDGLAQSGHEAGDDAIARDGVRGAQEQGFPVASDQRGRP